MPLHWTSLDIDPAMRACALQKSPVQVNAAYSDRKVSDFDAFAGSENKPRDPKFQRENENN